MIIILQKNTKFALVRSLGPGDSFFNPLVNLNVVMFAILGNLKMLIFNSLFIAGNTDATIIYNKYLFLKIFEIKGDCAYVHYPNSS